MPDNLYFELIAKHVSGNATSAEKETFETWLNESEQHKTIFRKIRTTWENEGEETVSLREKFSAKNLRHVLIQQALGHFVGFAVGLWISNSFTHYVTERRKLSNLFGLNGRKQIAVNDSPEWFQYLLSIVLGFLVLELINYFFQSKKHLLAWNFLKGKAGKNQSH